MKLRLERKYKKEKYTIGNLYVNGVFFCNVLEDKIVDINKNGTFDCGEFKISGHTAIPYGEYEVSIDIISPKFSKYPFYKEVCGGRLPRLLNVPAFEGILIHCADGPQGHKLVEGCLGIGYNTIRGGLTDGKKVFKDLYEKMKVAKQKREEIKLKII
jgi:hypothetical protein